jgi:hypothetical protein
MRIARHEFYSIREVFMQIDPFHIVCRALVAGVVVAGVAMGAGCSKRNDNAADTSSSAGAAAGMAPVPSVQPGGMASEPGAASVPAASGS